jgi:hypothetical protein
MYNKKEILNFDIMFLEILDTKDLNEIEDILYHQYRLVRAVRRYKELK